MFFDHGGQEVWCMETNLADHCAMFLRADCRININLG